MNDRKNNMFVKLALLLCLTISAYGADPVVNPENERASPPLTREPFPRVLSDVLDRRPTIDSTRDAVAANMLNEARRVGLTRAHFQQIQESLAEEYGQDITDMIGARKLNSQCTKYNEFIGNVSGYIGLISAPLAGATLFVSPDATNYIIYVGSIFALIKIFHLSLAKYFSSQAKDSQRKLDLLTNNIGLQTVNIVPTVTSPEPTNP